MKSDYKKGILNPRGTNESKNMFGGGNPHGLYVPMSETEQEVLARLVGAKDIMLIVHGWAVFDQPQILVGDLRVGIRFRLSFHPDLPPTTLRYLDLELQRRHDAQTIFRESKSIGNPIIVQGGMFLDMQWDIAVHSMDPAFVKAILPGAIGLTSRRIDRDTGQRTLTGNMQLDAVQQRVLHHIEKGAAAIREADAEALGKATIPTP